MRETGSCAGKAGERMPLGGKMKSVGGLAGRSGLFVTFEGGEGAGKSTQIRRLADSLRRAGHDVLVTHAPGGSPGAEAVRHVLVSGAAESERASCRERGCK